MALGLTPQQIIDKNEHILLRINKTWERVLLKELSEVQNGYAFSSKYFNNESGLPLIRIRDINKKQTENLYSGEYDDSFIVNQNDFLIGMDGDFRLSKWPGKKGLLNQRVCRLNFFSAYYDKEFFFLSIQPYLNAIHEETSSVTVKHLSSNTVKEIPLPLPPLPIQRAIVTKIEELFSSLDKAISDLKQAQDQLKIYRQAVLKKAFEGEYEMIRIDEVALTKTGSTPKRGVEKFWSGGTIPWVTSGALNNLYILKADEYITEVALKETNCKIIPKGSLLIAMYGEGKTRGMCSELKIDAATNQAIATITINEKYKESKDFIKWFFIKNYEEIRLLSSGGVQPNLNLGIIKSTIFPFPPLAIQKNIVKEIESRLSVCDQIEQTIKDSLKKAEALRQSILKKAFSGELLSAAEIERCKQEPDYEPADKLLARIQASNKIQKKTKK